MKTLIKPENTPDRDRSLLDLLLEGEDDKVKLKIHQIIQQFGIEPDDPMFLALIALTHCRLAVTPIPGTLESLCNEIKLHLVTLQSQSAGKVQECRDVATDINTIANRLSRQLAIYSAQSSSPLASILWAFFGSVCGSVLVLVLKRFF